MIAAAAVVLTVAVVLATWFAMHWALARRDTEVVEHRELAASVIFRVAALHGLILSLVFAQLVFDYRALNSEASEEAAALSDLYFDILRYDAPEALAMQQALRDYAGLVIDAEWPDLGRTRALSPEAWAAWDRAYEIVLDLVPATPREEALRDNMLSRVHRVAQLRDARVAHGLMGLDGLFWIPALAGVLVVAAGFHTFRPTRHNVFLLSLYGAFTGLVLFMIYALSDPFAEPGALRPSAFERLLSSDFTA